MNQNLLRPFTKPSQKRGAVTSFMALSQSRDILHGTQHIYTGRKTRISRDDDDKDDVGYDDDDAVAAGYDNDADEKNSDHFNKAETEDEIMTVMMTKTI